MPITVLAYMALSGHMHGPLSHAYAWRQVARDTKWNKRPIPVCLRDPDFVSWDKCNCRPV
jgi:hypothetical protein